MSNGTDTSTYRFLRELGNRVESTRLAVRSRQDLVIVQRFKKAATTETILSEARYLAKNWHPNVSRVRHVDVIDGEVFIATELIEGVTLSDLFAEASSQRDSGQPILTPALLIRIILDVLGGLQCIHGVRDESNAPIRTFHGAVCTQNIVIGKDGVARLIAVFRPRPINVNASSEALCYSAPELLEERGATPDFRSDLYACGVLLWEGLQGRRLYIETQPLQILQRQREEEIPWTAQPGTIIDQLKNVVFKALAFDPALRFRSTTEFVAALRSVAGTEIAAGSAVAQTVLDLAGERMRARRTAFERLADGGLAGDLPPPTRRFTRAEPAETPAAPPKTRPPSARATVPPPLPKSTSAGSGPKAPLTSGPTIGTTLPTRPAAWDPKRIGVPPQRNQAAATIDEAPSVPIAPAKSKPPAPPRSVAPAPPKIDKPVPPPPPKIDKPVPPPPPKLASVPPKLASVPPELASVPPKLASVPPELALVPPKLAPVPPKLAPVIGSAVKASPPSEPLVVPETPSEPPLRSEPSPAIPADPITLAALDVSIGPSIATPAPPEHPRKRGFPVGKAVTIAAAVTALAFVVILLARRSEPAATSATVVTNQPVPNRASPHATVTMTAAASPSLTNEPRTTINAVNGAAPPTPAASETPSLDPTAAVPEPSAAPPAPIRKKTPYEPLGI